MFRVSKQQIIFGGNYYTDILPVASGWIVWDKKLTEVSRDDFGDCELAWCSKGTNRIFRWLWRGFARKGSRNEESKVKLHPSQKPVGLLKKILLFYTEDDDIIFDPFLGSGSLAVACELCGRNWVGVEIKEEYCKIAKQRLLIPSKQELLF